MAVEGQETKAKPSHYHAVVRATGTLLPAGEGRKHPVLRLEGRELEGEVPLKRKRLSPAARKRLAHTLRRHPEGAEVGVRLWPRTGEGRLDLQASQVGLLHAHPKPELAGTFSVLGVVRAWEEAAGLLVLEVRPNPKGLLPKPFALELLVPGEGRKRVPRVGAEGALWVRGRVHQGFLLVEEVEAAEKPPEREAGPREGAG